MSKELEYLKDISIDHIKELINISYKSGNYILLEDIEKLYPSFFNKDSEIITKNNPILDICKSGNLQTFEFIKKKNVDINIKDDMGNGCLHYAAKYGNVQVYKPQDISSMINAI